MSALLLVFRSSRPEVATLARIAMPGTEQGVVLDAETTPAIDVTATEMLTQLAEDPDCRGVRLVVAHGLGQVRDILRQAGADAAVLLSMYATVDEAVESFADRPEAPTASTEPD